MSKHYIQRPPRLQPELPQGQLEIPPPPQFEDNPNNLLLQLVLPMVTIMGYVIVSVFGRGRSLVFLIPMGLSVLVSVAMSFYSRTQGRRQKAEQEAAYAERLIALRKEMAAAQDVQRRFYVHNYPDPQAAFDIAAAANDGATGGRTTSQSGTRLWERRTGDVDFGTLRLGIGALPSTVSYTLKGNAGQDSPLLRDAMRLAADSTVVNGVPITIPMRATGEDGRTPARHALGVVGSQANMAYGFLWSMLVHYAAFQAPADARLYVLGLDATRGAWRWCGSLPHCAGHSPGQLLCFEDDGDRIEGKEQSKVSAFLRGLRNVLEERKLRLEDDDNQPGVTLPHLLLVVDALPALPEGSALHDLEMDPAISLILQEGPRLGASIIFLVSHAGRVPGSCQAMVELTDGALPEDTTRGGHVGFRYAEVGLNTRRHGGRADTIRDTQALDRFARHLQPLMVRRTYGADLPRGVLMLEMLGIQTQAELEQAIRGNWQRSQQPEAAEWLNVALGMLSGGDVRRLKFSADADGVHGMIAGSTGSGKSELLMTMILGLAYNYDPSIVNFVLVDFKGGAAFEPFRDLPHVVDIVTNLRGNAVERMFAAIMAEIHRREAINVATNSKHIVHYRENGLHQRPYGQEVTVRGERQRTAPYPHLFVFIDEFAEMIAESPEYKAQLNSITRLGRALGVTLILAAQRPTGVTDQMRANIKFRIALRVETREESSEILRRPDAAYLPTGIPGRGYLQVGNENVELMQVAWTGSEFRGEQVQEKADVIWHDRRKKQAATEEEAPKVFEVMVDTMSDVAREHSAPQRKPWPDFLPENMTLQTPVDTSYFSPEGLNAILVNAGSSKPEDDGEDEQRPLNPAVVAWAQGRGQWAGIDWQPRAMRAVVGLIDDPYHAQQMPLVVDLRRGHAAIFGASGWGKTTFLRTLMASLTASHSPAELHIYALDFGGRQLNVFRDLPHVAAIVTPEEEERVTRLLRRLDDILERRKTLLSDAGADNLYSYNASHPGKEQPAILVVVDNFAEFREGFEHLMPSLISLVRESRAYGIHFVVSAELPNALTGKLYTLFTERLALKLSDPVEYTGIVGRGARAVEDIPGRGYVNVGRRALAFQAALPLGEAGANQELDETQKLAVLVRAMKDVGSPLLNGSGPTPIRTLANRVRLEQLLPTETGGSRRSGSVLAIDDRTLEPWQFDARGDGPHTMVIGAPASGKTTTLRSLVLSLAHTYPPEQAMMVLVDAQQRFFHYGGRRSLAELPHVVDTLSLAEELPELITRLEHECEYLAGRERALFVFVDNYDSFVDEVRGDRQAIPALARLAREKGTDGLHFIVAGAPDITRSPEELRKRIQMPRMGIALQAADLVSSLNGRVPRGLAGAELPFGRAFFVKSGRTHMLQIATPYEDDERIEASLDKWVERIANRYPAQRAAWTEGQEAPPSPEPAQTGPVEAAEPSPTAATGHDDQEPSGAAAMVLRSQVPEGVDVESLKGQLVEKGIAPSLLDLLSAVDIVNTAVELKILVLDEAEEQS